jgi:hypothetical protein
MISDGREGRFGFGPSPDGGFVRKNPNLELAAGKFAKIVERIIITHTSQESELLVTNDLKLMTE